MRVILLRSARRDLQDIGDWIARDNPDRAVTFVTELEEKAATLASMPRRAPVSHRTSRGAVYKLLHGRYLIYYRVLADRVEVVGIRHGAQRFFDYA